MRYNLKKILVSKKFWTAATLAGAIAIQSTTGFPVTPEMQKTATDAVTAVIGKIIKGNALNVL